MTLFTYTDSPLGRIMLISDGESLTGLYFDDEKHVPAPAGDWRETDAAPVFAAAKAQLAEYFAGTRTTFAFPLSLAGTPFQQAVWRQLETIPYGARLCYGDIANAIGTPRATRAVGAAIGRNPISIVVPCHRVVGKDGGLTGFAGGIERKRALLELEAGVAE